MECDIGATLAYMQADYSNLLPKAEAVMERHRANIEALDRALKAGRDADAAPPDELLLDDGFRRD